MSDHDHNAPELFTGDEERTLDETFAGEQRGPRRGFRYVVKKTPDNAKTEAEFRAELKAEREAERAGRKASKANAPTFAKTPTRRIPREEFKLLVTRAMLGDMAARDQLIVLTNNLGHKVLDTFDEETRRRAIMAVTGKLFGWGMLGIGIGVYFDLSRSGALVGYLATALRHAAIDEVRKKRTVRDAMEVSVPYESASEGEDGEQARYPALEASRLGHDEDHKPIIAGADSLDPLRNLAALELYEASMASNLTPQERRVAAMLAEGLDDPDGREDVQIAARLSPRISASRARALIASARKKIAAAQSDPQSPTGAREMP